MDLLTRRKFLLASGVTGAAALVAGGTAYGLADILGSGDDRPEGAGTLVLITLYGGNDGLNTVIPYGDDAYAKARPTLAYPPDQVLRLDDGFGLNPGLAGLHKLYGADRVAVVRGVGYPKPDHSHFRSMDIWQTADPVRPQPTGWIGRWLDTAGGDPRLAISFEPVLPPLLAGATSAGATVPGGALKLPKSVTPQLLKAFGTASAQDTAALARAAGCFTDLSRVQDLMDDVAESAPDETPDDNAEEPGATATGGAAGPLQQQLDQVARCVEAGAVTRVYSVSLGGFDLHADEKGAQQGQLERLDKPLAAFMDRMTRSEKGKDVVVAIYSEFGRRVAANASDGTDHGTASSVFLIGNRIRGGLYGEAPSLTDLDNGDLRYTTDFRDVYASLLRTVLDGEPDRVLAGWKGELDDVWK
ncbi:DUF1501 domain-containing protein [Winogradskya consettensis]|uniref:DUF1501 domain-containing protein n=1 Tax=Winogradskya consettensis TaxID=113560 RepID=A0A919SPZ6_9ACTN|nr:DUF1501 domain-containing protein [Actinoplanes consettensis]GIM76402.1 hypothetical protein Aco04nite_50240 [Actinoplanes consettensis]